MRDLHTPQIIDEELIIGWRHGLLDPQALWFHHELMKGPYLKFDFDLWYQPQTV